MSTATVEQFSTADLTTGLINAVSHSVYGYDREVFKVSIQGQPFVLSLYGSGLKHDQSGNLIGYGTFTSLVVRTLPTSTSLYDLETGTPLITVSGFSLTCLDYLALTQHNNDAGFQSALFGGADTFTINGPGPSSIDGGAGTDTVTYNSSSMQNGFGVDSLDGSGFGLTVVGPEGLVHLKNIETVSFGDGQSFGTSGILQFAELAAAYTGLAVAATSLPALQQALNGGTSFSAIEAQVANAPGANLPALVSGLYQAYLERDATAQEIAYWTGAFKAGTADYTNLSSALAGQPGAATALTDEVEQAFEALTGAGPTAAQLGASKALVGAGFRTVQALYAAAAQLPAFSAAAEAQAVAAAYGNLVGRAPSSGETSYWSGQLSAGAVTLGRLHSVLVSTADGQARLGADVGQLYDTFIGRDPTGDETSFWTAQLRSGQVNVDQLRLTLEGTASSNGFIPTLVTSLYEAFLGREPGAAETAYWTGLVATGVLEAAQVQQALASQPAAPAIIQDDVRADYQRDFGRDAFVGEVQYWTGQIQGGLSLAALDRVLLGTSEGQAHAGTEVNALYLSYFGHAASQGELDYWTPRVQSGQTSYAQIADVLATIGGSGVYQTTATAAPDHYGFSGAFGHIDIRGFDPVADTLGFSGHPGFLPLAHAETVADGSGHFDTLITLDAADTILLKGVTLGQLHATDFLVS